MQISSGRLFQVFKYVVYGLLTLNIFLFYTEESLAASIEYPDGVDSLSLFLEVYAATVDTAAWVFLLFMFELETSILEDKHYTPSVTRSLHALRVISYSLIGFAFYGYIETTISAYDTAPVAGLNQLCDASAYGQLYAIDENEYVEITALNCSTLSSATEFFRFADSGAVADQAGVIDIQRLGWADIINAGVWILIVLLLEIDVRLQEKNRYEGLALRASTAAKTVFYSTLFLAAIYWGFKGDFVDFWDAFLWLVAFLFIELNILEWRQEEHEKLQAGY